VELTEEQAAAARARGCAFFPASAEQVARLSMQRRVFTLGGGPFLATRDGGGFHETHATLARLIEPAAPGGPAAGGRGAAETVREAEAADAAAAREIEGERSPSAPGDPGGGARVVGRRTAPRPRPPWRGAKGGG
jgi:hypothetical protein